MSNPRKPSHLKLIDGTDQPCRRAPESVELPLVDAIPEPPDWLPNSHAIKEWQRLAPILYANRLLTDVSLSPLAMLCAQHGKILQMYAAGQIPTSAMLAQYRNLANDFALTPIAQGRFKPNPGGRPPNRFGHNGLRPSGSKQQDDLSFPR
jgi:phage terminase small subunit